jgi:hypothetical protein
VLLLASPALAQQAAGCYDLRVPPAHEMLPSADSIFLALPPRIELDTFPGRSSMGDRGFALREAPGALPSIHPHAWWEWSDPERLSLVWSTETAGVSMELRPSGDGLHGRMTAIWNFPRSGPEAAVEAIRVDCGAPLPEEYRAVYRLTRGIELETGDSVRIGEPLPSEIRGVEQLQPRLHRFPGVLGVFAEASEARVATDEAGVVRSIRMLFPEGTIYRELVAGFAEVQGPPSSSAQPPDPRGAAEWSAWQDRLVGVTIWNAVSADGLSEVTVLLRDPRF